jgi:hypothetical protein
MSAYQNPTQFPYGVTPGADVEVIPGARKRPSSWRSKRHLNVRLVMTGPPSALKPGIPVAWRLKVRGRRKMPFIYLWKSGQNSGMRLASPASAMLVPQFVTDARAVLLAAG